MDSEKRVLIAFVLSFVVLMFWKVLFVKETAPPKPVKAAQSVQGKSPSAPAGVLPAPQSSKPAPLALEQGSEAEDVVIESDLYRVTFSTQGGVVKSWILKRYHDSNGKPLDVVNGPACEELGYPMSIDLADSGLAAKLNRALYVATPGGTSLKAPATLEFAYSDGKIEVRKRFSFGAGYEVQSRVSVFDGLRYLPVEVAWPGGVGDHSLPDLMEAAAEQAAYDSGGDLKTLAQPKVSKEQSISGPLAFAGLEDSYFAGIFFPRSPDGTFRFDRKSWTPANWNGKETPASLVGVLGSPRAKPLDFGLFVAPKDLDVLRSTEPPLDGLVNFGWFSLIAKPLFLGMRYIYDHWVHNYGWAIIILTIILNMFLFPLKLKSIRSAQEMQRIAPHVKAIQERYKQYKFNDPRKQRMNQEMMKLYQEHGINPLGGCLPMLLQFPILIGFYETLETPIELRHAPWVLWIKDLSMPDHSRLLGLPVPILPTIMIVTMFALQKMTPIPTADPAQKRMMMLMPLFMGVIFYRLASGLVVYYLTANLVGIAQQLIINRFITPKLHTAIPQKAAPEKA